MNDNITQFPINKQQRLTEMEIKDIRIIELEYVLDQIKKSIERDPNALYNITLLIKKYETLSTIIG